MVKTCAASEMGQTAFMLVAIVATTEDAAGYTRPVTFFNDALLPLIGIRKWDTLDRARKSAVDAGWLEYEPPANGKRTPGRYWAKIPSHLEGLNDTPVDEEATKAYPMNGDDSGKAYPVNGDDPPKAYTLNGYGSGNSSPMNGEGMGEAMGEPSSYTYTKKEKSVSSKTGKKKPTSDKPRKYSQAFLVWYAAYPKKTAKPKAAESFTKAVSRLLADPERNFQDEAQVAKFLTRQATAYASANSGSDQQFLKHPATWLNQDCFDDEYKNGTPQSYPSQNGQSKHPGRITVPGLRP